LKSESEKRAASNVIRVSASKLSRFLECRQKVAFGMAGWKLKVQKDYRTWGSLFHASVELAGAKKLKGAVAAQRVCEMHRKEVGGTWGANQEQAHEVMQAQLEATVPAYLRKWKKDDAKVEILEREIEFEVPWTERGNQGISLIGFMDGRLRRVFDSALGVLEEKTSSRINEVEIMETLERDFQTNFYLVAHRALWGEPGFVRYGVTRRCGLKRGTSGKRKETIDQYRNRVAEHIAADPGNYFLRFHLDTDADELENFEKELSWIIGDYKHWLTTGQPVRAYGNPCLNRYGRCEYLPLCFNGEEYLYTKEKHAPKTKKAKG